MAINQIYAVGAALVDTEVTVSDSFLSGQGIEKGIMTLVDQSRQAELLDALNSSEACILQQSGGSACNSVVAAAQFGANSCFGGKWPTTPMVCCLPPILNKPMCNFTRHNLRLALPENASL